LRVLGSRHAAIGNASYWGCALMNPKFAVLVETLSPKPDRLLEMLLFATGRYRRICLLLVCTCSPREAATYTWAYRTHCGDATAVIAGRAAALAFQLARKKTGHRSATYQMEGGRDWLMQQPWFRAAFEEGKARIRDTEYRFVEEPDQNRQAL
jgi:hypothetical protein